MGGIACVTPPGTVEKSLVKRTLHPLTAEVVGTFGQIPIKTYSQPATPGPGFTKPLSKLRLPQQQGYQMLGQKKGQTRCGKITKEYNN